ncbi:MAG: sigma-54 dependent transcriptional regulator [Pseudomonadota bacterium]
MAIDVLVVDDEEDIRELIGGLLEDEGYNPRLAADSDEALGAIQERLPALVVLDIWLQGSKLDGLEVLDEIKSEHRALPVVVISGHGTIETAVSAIKRGAYDFVEKPFKADRLSLVVQRALEASRLKRENSELRAQANRLELLGSSPVMTQVRQVIDKVADARSRVLITGPSGSGKEVIARLIHAKSSRSDAPFVPVNAAAIAPERMEIELFGIEAAGDAPRKVGLFEQAHGGTLLIDEVGDMPLETQGKILRVLVDQTFERVGSRAKVQVDVRVISSTSKDLQAEAAQGRFREDLFHRLNVVPIRAPSLAERRDDIPVLAEHFLTQLSASMGATPRRLAPDAMAALQAYDWPGNVRQLRNIAERILILATGGPDDPITCEMLPAEIVDGGPAFPRGQDAQQIIALPLRDARERFEREYLMAQINRFGGNISRTAAFIGMERSALHRKLKSLGVTGLRQEKVDA